MRPLHSATLAFLLFRVGGGTASAQPVASRFDAVIEASPDEYAARRAELLTGGRGARSVLEREIATGTDAVRRMIARALRRRLDAPARAAALDRWRMSRETASLHNPEFRAEAELAAAFRGEPALAFERLFAVEASSAWEARALGSVVAAGGGDAFAALGSLVARHPALADTLLRLDRAGAEDVLLRAIDRVEDPDAKPSLISALGRAAGPRPGPTLSALRRMFTTSRDDDVRRAAAEALGQRGDRVSVSMLFDSLAEPDQTAGQGTRREITVRALGRILGPAELDRQILERLRDPRETIRQGAAYALGNRAPDVRGRELLPTLPRDTEALARLAGDPSAAVRVTALESLAWLAIRVDVGSSGPPPPRLPAAVRDRVLSALTAAHLETRRHALDALWRLGGAGLVGRDATARRAIERVFREDPDDQTRRFARQVLDSFSAP
jgi:HEAT repeat protein